MLYEYISDIIAD